jgi:hypothetical protein
LFFRRKKVNFRFFELARPTAPIVPGHAIGRSRWFVGGGLVSDGGDASASDGSPPRLDLFLATPYLGGVPVQFSERARTHTHTHTLTLSLSC